jgi:hypothetical protein
MTTRQREAIERHGRQLLAIFPNATERDPVKLCRQLRKIQGGADLSIIRHCNYGLTEESQDQAEQRALDALDRVLAWRAAGVPVFVNWDPRGYALKIRDEWVRAQGADIARDWGGYGIIAPEIGEEG